MIVRIYHKRLGGHVHMRVFAGETEGALGKAGDLCLRVEEFNALLGQTPTIEFCNEDEAGLMRERYLATEEQLS